VNTLKSAALVVVLFGVLYGVYVALSKPEFAPGAAHTSETAGDFSAPLVEFGPAATSAPQMSLPPPPLAPRHESDNSAAPFTISAPRTGTYQPPGSADSLPPPTVVPAPAPSLDPTASSGSELKRSSHETPVTTPSDPVSNAASFASVSPINDPTAPVATSDLTPASASSNISAVSLRRDWPEVQQLVEAGKFKSALAKLSPHYLSTDLAADQRAQLVAWLDALAAKVIYSPDHLLAEPHRVRKGEVLFDIAKQYNVSWMLLQSINHRQVSDPMVLVPGTDLKIVPGPFRADVNLAASEVTLFVGELYAGRFPFTLGDQPPQPGQFKVVDKQQDQRSYYGLDGRIIPANDPSNPYGGWWISLGGEICIHGSPLAAMPSTLGCVSLSPQDAKDVYSILSMGSDVTIRR
jgi:LysM repeat protein